MPTQSVAQRTGAIPSGLAAFELYQLVLSLRNDVEALRLIVNSHVHSGVTVGAGNTGALVTPAAALNTVP